MARLGTFFLYSPLFALFALFTFQCGIWVDLGWLTLVLVRQFISSRGNEYFCEIDEDYLTDRFNLTGLNTEVQYYQYALDLVTDVFDLDCDDEMRETIEKSARHLYGLVHARYIVTTRGLTKMVCFFSFFFFFFPALSFILFPVLLGLGERERLPVRNG